jgi:DNA (cytosine-5)-methyltransferase 1
MTDPQTATSLSSLCSGYGGLDLAIAQVLNVRTAWVADPDPGAAAILAHHWPDVPNLGDITVTDWSQVPAVDIVCAGFPCQDISYAGRGEGIREGNRSGLWHVIADALAVLRPGLIVLENVAAIVGRRPGLDVVLADLAALGFDAEWTCVRASDIGAPHRRERWFLIATDAAGERHGNAGPSCFGGLASAAVAGAAAHAEGAGWEARREGLPRTGDPAAYSQGDGRDARRTEPTRQQRRPDAALCGVPTPADTDRGPAWQLADVQWGTYGPTIDRWGRSVGRPAPHPREPAPQGGERLSPAFVEWMMGLPAGWVTDVPGLTRNQQLKALGNGVVPQQAAHALSLLLNRAAMAS